MKYKKITREELEQFLRKHKLWLRNEKDGEKANLSWADLSGANLSGANLSGADLSWADQRGANLREADLSGANLREANLREADLSGANLSGADLSWADLSGANLSGADLSWADLDYSVLPLWCGSLRANFDDKQLTQIAYHLVKAGLGSTNASKETKTELAKLIDFANNFHRVEECGKIEKEQEKNGENQT